MKAVDTRMFPIELAMVTVHNYNLTVVTVAVAVTVGNYNLTVKL